ncbi:MAG: flippase-like domain-containing protein [Hydrogenobacter sp.]
MYRSILYGSLITILIIFATALYILKKTFSKELLNILFLLEKRYIILALLSMFFYHTFDNIRLFVLSRAMGMKYSFAYGYVISLINTFGATVTPAHLGGEFLSIYTLMRKGGQLHKVMSVVTMKTLTGASFFILAFPLTVYALFKNPSQAKDLLELVAIVLTIAGTLYVFLRIFLRKNSSNGKFTAKIKNTLKRYAVTMKIFLRDKKRYILGAVVSSVLLYISFLSVGVFLVKAFHADVDTLSIFLNQLFLVYALFISPTPGGSGVGELGALSVFSPFLEPFILGIFALIWRFVSQYLSALIGGILLSALILIDTKKLKDGN